MMGQKSGSFLRRMEMASIALHVNGEKHTLDIDPDVPLLWALRDLLGATGTKYSCGIGVCGSCTVLLDGRPIRSCITPVSAVQGQEVITIEGLSKNGDHPLQKAWIEEEVAQCGYCQPGQILTAVALLNMNPNPTDAEIDAWMSGNLCRCGTYQRIRQAIKRASAEGVRT
jgi:isoquinoline 1-oxidoreductase alpha subunit